MTRASTSVTGERHAMRTRAASRTLALTVALVSGVLAAGCTSTPNPSPVDRLFSNVTDGPTYSYRGQANRNGYRLAYAKPGPGVVILIAPVPDAAGIDPAIEVVKVYAREVACPAVLGPTEGAVSAGIAPRRRLAQRARYEPLYVEGTQTLYVAASCGTLATVNRR